MRSEVAANSPHPAWRLATSLVLLVTLVAWLRVPFGAFQHDDRDSVSTQVATPAVADLADAWRAGFRPLLRSSYLVERRLWGTSAAGFLVVNFAIHLACALAVLALARRRDLLPLGGAAAAVAFALQPAQAEAVAYVSGRSSSLMTLFVLAGLLAHDRAAEAPTPRRRWRWLVFALASFGAAVAVKEVALVFPLLVAIWELARRERRWGRVRPLLAAHAAAAAGLAAVALGSAWLRGLIAFSIETVAPMRALAANLALAPRFVGLWARPGALSIEHPVPAISAAAVAVGAALVACAVGCGLFAARRRPPLALALLWVPVVLLPTNSLLWKLDPISERSLYLAWVAPALALGAAIESAWRHAARRTPLRAALAVLLACSALAAGWSVARRVEVWRDARALWSDAARKAPESPRAWNNLGMAHWERGELALARAAFRRAASLAPGDALALQNLFALALVADALPPAPEGETR